MPSERPNQHLPSRARLAVSSLFVATRPSRRGHCGARSWQSKDDKKATDVLFSAFCGKEPTELTASHASADVGCVRRVVEEVRVRIERDARPRVTKDAADMGDVEPQVDDQVAGEGVAKIMYP